MAETNALSDRVRAALGDAYRVERELPPGGMSRLFLATERSLDRQVVVKVLPPELASEVSAARFQREMTTAAQLQHPHILPVLSAGGKDGLLYYITPFVTGESLRDRVNREGRLPVADAVRILSEVADALARANRAGVVHRDIKPENILLQDGHALLADFGVARALHEATGAQRLTEAGMAPGTPSYMAPEQLAGDQQVDARTDIYALAVVGYEMLAGTSPFGGPTPQAVAAAHFTSAPRPLGQVRPDVPRAVSDAIGRALSREPDARFATAAEFRDALTETHARARPRPWVRWGAGIVVLGAAAAVVLLMRGRSHGPKPLDPNLIAVEPFTVLDPSLAVWREGMVDVLARNFDGAGPLRSVAPTLVVHRAADATTPDLARALGAGLAVTGTVERSGADSVRVIATLSEVGSGRPGEEIAVRGPTAHMDWVTDSVTVALLRNLARTHAVGAVRGSLSGAKSLPALKALLESEQAFRRGGWDSAQAAAEAAIRLDSTFALAYYAASFAVGWSHGADSLAKFYAQRAQTYNHGLSPRDSLLIASNAQLESYRSADLAQLREMNALAADGVRRYPDDPQVWDNLGEVRFHVDRGPVVGVRPQSALEAFGRAIALDSSFAPAYVHAMTLAMDVMGRDSMLKYAHRFLALNPPSVDADAARLQVLLLGVPRDTVSARRLADSTSPDAVVRAIVNLFLTSDSGESAAWLADALVRRQGPFSFVDGAPPAAQYGYALLSRGHVRQTWALLVRFARQVPTGRVAGVVGDIAVLGVIPTTTVDSLLRIPANLADGWSWHGLRQWADRGDTADLERFLSARAAHKGFDRPREERPAAYDTAAARAYLWLARHDTTSALRRFEELPDTLCGAGCVRDVISRAELLTIRGRAAEADSLLQRQYDLTEGVTDILRQLALGRAAEQAGDRATAVDAYAKVEDAWAQGDPEVQPAVNEARTALTRLGRGIH